MVTVLLVGGCGSNFDAQTNQVYQPAVGTNSRDGDVYALNMLVVAEGDAGTLVGALLNRAVEEDTLMAVEGSAGGQAALTAELPSDGLQLAPQRLAQLVEDGPVDLTGAEMAAGSILEVTLRFANAAPITMRVPVVAPTGDYASIPVPE